MNIQKSGKSYVKKHTGRTRQALSGSRDILFFHKATAGQMTLDLTALVMPIEITVSQATQSEILSAQIFQNWRKVSLNSSLRGTLINGFHFRVTSGTTIELINDFVTTPAYADEIFSGRISAGQVGDLSVPSANSVVKSYDLAVSQSILPLATEYKINGAMQVFVNGVLAERGVVYNEVESGNGYGSTIQFLQVPNVNPWRVTVNFGVFSVTSQDGMGAIEQISGSLAKIAQDLAQVTGGSQSDYTTATPSTLDRVAFGDKVLAIDSKYDTSSKLSEYTKTKSQEKILPGTLSSTQTAFTFNNLEIGKTYSFYGVCDLNGTNGAGGHNLQFSASNGAQSFLLGIIAPSSTINIRSATGFKQTFVATATTLNFTFTMASGAGQLIAGTTRVTLEEKPNHQLVTQWN